MFSCEAMHGGTRETKSDRLKLLWILYFKIPDSKYFRLIVLWAFELVSFFSRQFDPRPIESLLWWIVFTLLQFVKIYLTDFNRHFTIEMNNSGRVAWRFKFYGLCHLIVEIQFNVIETNLYDQPFQGRWDDYIPPFLS